ncbi:MAG: DMT family transporter [Nocardioides sp.]
MATHPRPPSGGALPFLPALGFVLVWSSGYIAGPYGVTAMKPLSLVGWRFIAATVIVAVLARVVAGPLRADRATVLRICLVGFVMNGLQFGAMYLAFDAGLGATLGALLHSLSPVLTAVIAGVALGERLLRVQVLGFVVGVAGVLLVLGPDIDEAGGAVGLAFAVVGVLSLSLGTIGQRWIGRGVDPLWSAALQFAVSGPPVLLLAVLIEGTDPIIDLPKALGVLAYLAVVNSIIGLILLGVLVRHGGASAGASVFFLMPPVTAVMAWLVLGDTLTLREGIGLVIAVAGVAAATRAAPVVPEEPPS